MRQILAGLVAMVMVASSQAIIIKVDYTYAPNALKDANSDAHKTLEKAATDLGTALTNAGAAPLAEVTTGSYSGTTGAAMIAFDWSVHINDPSDLTSTIVLPDSVYPILADTFTIYAGASTAALNGNETLGEGAPSSGEYNLNPIADGTLEEDTSAIHKAENLFNAALTRGNGPRLYVFADSADLGGTTVNYTLNVGSLAGFLTFDQTAKWHFDSTTMPANDEYDFYTVMLHEMMHSLGFGSSVSWNAKKSGANWSGQHVIDLQGTGNGLIHEFYNNDSTKPDGGHIADGVMSEIVGTNTAQAPVMDSSLVTGVRKQLTKLDIAFLLDLDTPAPAPVSTATPTPTPTPTPAPTPVPTAPLTPVFKGKPPKSTTLSKVTLSGTLFSPGAYVVYKIGLTGKLVKAKGGANWKAVIKLKPGKNVIYIGSYDPVSELTSKLKKITITRQ